ncbi:MAG: hypothetical protein ACRC57_11890 [Sarcina sp.]
MLNLLKLLIGSPATIILENGVSLTTNIISVGSDYVICNITAPAALVGQSAIPVKKIAAVQ